MGTVVKKKQKKNKGKNLTEMDEVDSPGERAMRCHLIQKLILKMMDFEGLLKLRQLTKIWLVLANEEIEKRGGLCLQFRFDVIEKEYIHVPAPSRIFPPPRKPIQQQQQQQNSTNDFQQVPNLEVDNLPSTSSGVRSDVLSDGATPVSSTIQEPVQKKYLRDLAELLGTSIALFPCDHFTFSCGDLKSGGAREFFYNFGENVKTLVLNSVSPSEETMVSLLLAQCPYVKKLSLSLSLTMHQNDWIPEEHRKCRRDPAGPPVLHPFRVNLDPLKLHCMEILHFSEDMQKRDWRKNVAMQLVLRSPNLKVISNLPLYQFNTTHWEEKDKGRMRLLKEFTISKNLLLVPAPTPPPNMTLPLFAEHQRRLKNSIERGVGRDLVDQVIVGEDGSRLDPTDPEYKAFLEAVRAFKDQQKFTKAKPKLKMLRYELGQDSRPLEDQTIVSSWRHLAADFDRMFTSSQESLQVLEWEFLDSIPENPELVFNNVQHLSLQVNTAPEQTFKVDQVNQLFPNLKSLKLTYLQQEGTLVPCRRWDNYFSPPAPAPPINDGFVSLNTVRTRRIPVTCLESVEELELSDNWPCTRWEKFREMFPNLKKLKGYPAASWAYHGQLFVYWPNLEVIEWDRYFKMTREESRIRVLNKQHQLDSKITEALAKAKRERETKMILWIPEPQIFSS